MGRPLSGTSLPCMSKSARSTRRIRKTTTSMNAFITTPRGRQSIAPKTRQFITTQRSRLRRQISSKLNTEHDPFPLLPSRSKAKRTRTCDEFTFAKRPSQKQYTTKTGMALSSANDGPCRNNAQRVMHLIICQV